MSSTAFSSVYNLANLTAPASGVTHGAKWLIIISAGVSVTLSMQSQMEFLGNFIGQAIMIDNTANASALTIEETTYGWTRQIQAGELRIFQYPACPNQRFVFSSTGNLSVPFTVFDFPAFPDSDYLLGNASGIPVTVLGTVTVSDPVADTYLAQLQRPVTLVSRSTLSVGSVSTQLMAANPTRQYLLIQAPVSADLWINPLGGTAAIDAADCFKIAAGGTYESPGGVVWNGDIEYFTTAAAATIAAVEAG